MCNVCTACLHCTLYMCDNYTLIAICDTMSSISLVILVSRASSSLPSGKAVLLATPQLGHTHSNDLAMNIIVI